MAMNLDKMLEQAGFTKATHPEKYDALKLNSQKLLDSILPNDPNREDALELINPDSLKAGIKLLEKQDPEKVEEFIKQSANTLSKTLSNQLAAENALEKQKRQENLNNLLLIDGVKTVHYALVGQLEKNEVSSIKTVLDEIADSDELGAKLIETGSEKHLQNLKKLLNVEQVDRDNVRVELAELMKDEEFLSLLEKLEKEKKLKKPDLGKQATPGVDDPTISQNLQKEPDPEIRQNKDEPSLAIPESKLVNKYKDLEIAWPKGRELKDAELAVLKEMGLQPKINNKGETVVGGLTEEMAAKVAVMLADKGIYAKDSSPDMIVTQRMDDAEKELGSKIKNRGDVLGYIGGKNQELYEEVKARKAKIIPLQYSGQNTNQETKPELQALKQTIEQAALNQPVKTKTEEEISLQAVSAGGKIEKAEQTHSGGIKVTVSNEMGTVDEHLSSADVAKINKEISTPFKQMNTEQKEKAVIGFLKDEFSIDNDGEKVSPAILSITPQTEKTGIWPWSAKKETGNYICELVDPKTRETVTGIITQKEVQAFLDKENAKAAEVPVQPTEVEQKPSLIRPTKPTKKPPTTPAPTDGGNSRENKNPGTIPALVANAAVGALTHAPSSLNGIDQTKIEASQVAGGPPPISTKNPNKLDPAGRGGKQ